VLAKESLDGNTWVLSHRPDKECALHNHAPSENASAHPVHRQLDRKDIDIVSSLTTVGVAPRDIGSSLHNNSDTLVTQQDVYPIKKAPSKCSKCHQVGHRMGANVCPLKYSEQLPASPLAQDATSKVLGNSTAAETYPSAQVQAKFAAPPDLPLSKPLLPTTAPEPTGRPTVPEPTAPESTEPSTAPKPTGYGSMPSASVKTVDATPGLLNHISPEAIYGRYVAARSAWYAEQPAGSVKTDQQYRKAMKLPLRYSKSSYNWCLDYKNMGKRCRIGYATRPWTMEEMTAYIDWSKAEDTRIERVVRKEVKANGFGGRTRGLGYIWALVDKDIEEQNRLYG
jgi:hypothetical protein